MSGQRFHHSLKERQSLDRDVSSPASFQISQNPKLVQQQLDRALALALDAVGFDDAEPLAMECFRSVVEAYMRRFLLLAHCSMVSARRRTPVPLDFQVALSANNLTFNSLLPHLDPPVYNSKTTRHPVLSSRSEVLPSLHLQPPATSSDGFDTSAASSKQEAILDRILGGAASTPSSTQMNGVPPSSDAREQRFAYVPGTFPTLPSKHTYKSNPVLPSREKDPQKIRERATEDGRLGEEALRRLAAKQAELRKAREEREKKDQEHAMDVTDGSEDGKTTAQQRKRKATNTNPSSEPRGTVVFRGRAESIYKGLMAGIAAGSSEVEGNTTIVTAPSTDPRERPGWNGGLNEPINAERVYWRQTAKRSAANG